MAWLYKSAQVVVALLGCASVVTVIFALTARDEWWMRAVDYPRLQITVLSIILLLLSFALFSWSQWLSRLYLLILALATGYQLYVLAPYWFPRQPAAPTLAVQDPHQAFSLLSANVRMGNRDSAAFLAIVDQYDPDLLLVMEPNDWWMTQLQPLRDRYPYRVEQPQENYYGIAFYSRFPLLESNIQYFEDNHTPSVYALIELPTGAVLTFYGEHPRPPLPENSVSAADKELLLVANRVRATSGPVLVAGDFNDVPWSFTVESFAEISQLRDIRIGRGFYNSFDAENPILRLPIDQIYLSRELGIVEFADPIRFSSDHFALFARIAVE